jgi:uncharacterized protein
MKKEKYSDIYIQNLALPNSLSIRSFIEKLNMKRIINLILATSLFFACGMGEAGGSKKMNSTQNRLADVKNPYLQQHADNPVDWYPWSDEAFELAQKEDKPIFLSIGYSTCHWCHVMAHESFEDSATAAMMNKTFVNIKVDREERPDIDAVYMRVCQMLTGSGGWPLTIIMTPDKKPFFAGTYFPKETVPGRIGMIELIEKIDDLWKNRRDDINSSADNIIDQINKSNQTKKSEEIEESILPSAFESYKRTFDKDYGGFGQAPKFPVPHNLRFLLGYSKRYDEELALEMVESTLEQMRAGGIFDHVGYGFHRYSTDRVWLLPHFEKMLYDQAQLAMAYTDAYQLTKNSDYKKITEEVLEYVSRDLTHPKGGFYSAEDADSEGVEGKFYVWSVDEIKSILGDDSDLIILMFNAKDEGNFTEETGHSDGGNNILHLSKSMAEWAEELEIDESELEKKIELSRKKLFDVREKRVHPHKDEKILTDWNALMISAFARAGRIFGNDHYIHQAEKAIQFIEKYLFNDDGELLHRFFEGGSGIDAMIDDYSLLVAAYLDLYEATFETDYMAKAVELNERMIVLFKDLESGGYFNNSGLGEKLISRMKEIYDGAIPSGNSQAFNNLLHLWKITGESKYLTEAKLMITAFSGQILEYPPSHSKFLSGMDFLTDESVEIVIAGKKDSEETKKALEIINSVYFPNKVVLLKYGDDLDKLAGYTKEQVAIDGKTTIYFCKNFACEQPFTDIDKLKEYLK